ncbi:unnamed protein product [Bursaphelenchus xylophilus]|nr:unnamed protein product [Bursaphelenchus xylophilus]CAG9130486.1 unnamed protein product [Bursaphelenchus xylophilus]
MSESESEKSNARLKKGEVVEASHGNYVVMRLLGEGGFGAVYRVENRETKREYAMKVEYKSRKQSKLKMEIAILRAFDSMARKSYHFTRIVDRGKAEGFQFVVMTLVGPSLEDMKKERPNKVFTPGTAFGAGIQCLEAIEQLHRQQYIHRDIKPANYARGLELERRIIFLLDFGIARKFTNENGDLKTPRNKVPFKGTVRFAAINCHRHKELSPKDDVESWIYLLLDFLVVGGLPWKKFSDKEDVLLCKMESRKPERRNKVLFGNMKCDSILGRVVDYVDKLTYTDHVDYGFIYDHMKLASAACQANIEDPYDWEKS